jgi:3-hydroxyanthranilate 3,4-dioxygenase
MPLPGPLNLQAWIAEHRHLLQPPVGNKCIVDDDYIVMVVGGPNARTDYHFEDGPEWFYQLEGEMVLRVQEDYDGERGTVRDIPIRAGEMFYLPPRVPHSPQRMPGSVGLVIERRRLAHEDDALMWFCVACNRKLYAESFHLVDIERDFFRVFERFYRDDALRTCPDCGTLNPRPTRYEMDADSRADIT